MVQITICHKMYQSKIKNVKEIIIKKIQIRSMSFGCKDKESRKSECVAKMSSNVT